MEEPKESRVASNAATSRTREIKYRATMLVHWPTGPVPACDMHGQQLAGLADFLGSHVALTKLDEPAECVNCVNEARSGLEG